MLANFGIGTLAPSLALTKAFPGPPRGGQRRHAKDATARWRSGDAEAVQGLPAWFESRPGLQSLPLSLGEGRGVPHPALFSGPIASIV